MICFAHKLGHENGDYEFQATAGETPDSEFGKEFPFQVDGLPSQYQTHDFHHNVFKEHMHAPYNMHNAHGDCKYVFFPNIFYSRKDPDLSKLSIPH